MRTALLVLLTAGLTLLAACGSSGPATQRPPVVGDSTAAATAPPGVAPVGGSGSCTGSVAAEICVTVAITGAAAVSGSSITVAPEPPDAGPSTTCAQLATDTAGGARELGDSLPAVAGHAVDWDLSFAHYTGPGTYPLGSAEFSVTVDNNAFTAGTSTTGTLTVGADFATSIAFRGLTSSSTSGAISGRINWTCADPQ